MAPGETEAVRQTVLVVEDDEAILKAMVRILQHNFEVATATNVKDALAIVPGQEVHLVITDLNMPGGTGLDLVRALRSQGYTVPAIVVTGAAEKQEIDEALRQGLISGVVQKPWNMLALLASVWSVLQPE